MRHDFERFGHPTKWLKKVLLRRQNGKCALCGCYEWDIDDSFQVHRIITNGEYHPDNTELLCPKCHREIHKEVV